MRTTLRRIGERLGTMVSVKISDVVLSFALLFSAALVCADLTLKLDSFTNLRSPEEGQSSIPLDVTQAVTTEGRPTTTGRLPSVMPQYPSLPSPCRKESESCKEYHHEKSCHCDDICLLMNDCCDDHSVNTSLTEKEQSRYYDHLQCQEDYTEDFRFSTYMYMYGNQAFLMIKTCPFRYSESEDVRTLCEDGRLVEFLNWPVTSRVSHVTFRNIYCSICWGESDVFFWKVSYEDCEGGIDPKFPVGITLDPFSDKTRISSEADCDETGVQHIPPDSYNPDNAGGDPVPPDLPPDPFTEKPVVEKNSESANYSPGKRFALGQGPKDFEIETGRAQKSTTSSEKPTIPKEDTTPSKRDERGIPQNDVLIPLPIPTEEGTEPESSIDLPPPDIVPPAKCELLRFILPNCKNLRTCDSKNLISTCPSGYENQFIADRCKSYGASAVKVSSTEKVYKNQFCALCNGHAVDWASYTSEIPNDLPSDGMDIPLVGGDYLLCHILLAKIEPEWGIPPPALSLIFDPRAGVMVKKNWDGSTNEIPLPHCEKDQIVDVFGYTCRDVFCPKGRSLQKGTCVEIGTDPDNHLALADVEGLKINTTNSTEGCLWLMFTEDEYTMLQNGTVFVNSSEDVVYLPWWRYSVSKNSSILICETHLVNRRRNSQRRISLESVEGPAIVSLICSIISLVCLATQFIIYLVLPEMRNTACLTIMSLVAALFMAQLMFLVGSNRTENITGCVFFAAVIHYLFLATFFWMSALAFDLTLTFSATRASFGDERSKRRRFLKICIYAWGCPFIVVSISLILDAFKDNVYPYNPGYGQGFCWITNQRGLILFFLGPVGLLLMSCIIMYVITVYHILKASREAEMVRKERKCTFLLYVKLSIIMGITWIFAYIWIATGNLVMEYAFIVVNGLQGAFIFAAFVCRKKVYSLLQKKLKRQPRLASAKDTASTSLKSSKT